MPSTPDPRWTAAGLSGPLRKRGTPGTATLHLGAGSRARLERGSAQAPDLSLNPGATGFSAISCPALDADLKGVAAQLPTVDFTGWPLGDLRLVLGIQQPDGAGPPPDRVMIGFSRQQQCTSVIT